MHQCVLAVQMHAVRSAMRILLMGAAQLSSACACGEATPCRGPAALCMHAPAKTCGLGMCCKS